MLRGRYLDAASSAARTTSLGLGVIKPRHGDDGLYAERLSLTPHNGQLKMAITVAVIFVFLNQVRRHRRGNLKSAAHQKPAP